MNRKSSSSIFSFRTIAVIGMCFLFAEIGAQNSHRIEATYKVEVLREIAPVKEVQARMILNKTRTALSNLSYLLKIENEKSLFEVEAGLSREQDQLYDDLALILSRLNLTTYTNKEESVQVIKKRGLGKEFLVRQDPVDFQWQLTGEKREILDFPAQKAVGTFRNMEGKPIEVHAWFTPAIPVQSGPDIFQGLPGLILEVEFSERRIFLSQLDLDPKRSFNITEPEDAESATVEEYMKKSEKAMKIMGFQDPEK